LSCNLGYQTFKHKDVEDLENRRTSDRVLVLTDGMFAHDGSIAPLTEYHSRLPKEDCILVDDSHGAGVLGGQGRGTHELCGVPRARLIQTTTLSKAFGAFGGVILGSEEFCRKICEKSAAFSGSTPMPLPCAGAALEATKLLKNPVFRERLWENCARVGSPNSPIISVIP